MRAIKVKNIKKQFNGDQIYSDLSLDVERGDIIALVGPNGCGKSTLLNILSGIITQDEGDYSIADFDRHKFSYIFQNYREALFPWRSNYKNLAYPLEVQNYREIEIKDRIKEVTDKFNLNFNLEQRPYEMSGGQQQILAFLRALVNRPKLLFIDEAFSALDFENSLYLREKLQEYYLEDKPTIIFISHNIEEAVQLANKIVVFSKKPAYVVDIINNPLTYPRNTESLKEEEFHQIKNKVLTVFQKVINHCNETSR